MKNLDSQSEKLAAYIPIKWRVQSTNQYNAICTCYIDSRDVMARLDEVFGVGGWQRDHKELKGRMYAGIGIKNGSEWVWKWDAGAESTQDKGKGEASDSFKRAGVNFDIGRFKYDVPTVKLPVTQKGEKYNEKTRQKEPHFRASKVKDDESTIFYSNEALTDYINSNLQRLTGKPAEELDRLMHKPAALVAERSAIANVINAGLLHCTEPQDFAMLGAMINAAPKIVRQRVSDAFRQQMNTQSVSYNPDTKEYSKATA